MSCTHDFRHQVRAMHKTERRQRSRYLQRSAGTGTVAVLGHERNSENKARWVPCTSADANLPGAISVSAVVSEA